MRFDVPTEIKEYYRKLLESNATVKKQFDAIARQSELYDSGGFGPGEPQVIEWHPHQQEWDVSGFRHDQHFLMIQPLQFGRSKWLESGLSAVSEFHVVHEGKTRVDPKDPKGDVMLISNKITLQFLGFRTLTLTPVEKAP